MRWSQPTDRRRMVVASALALVVLSGVLVACRPVQRVVTYRVASRGVVHTDLEGFADHAALTLADRRGWSLGGALRFVRVDGPADFTLWLAAPGSMASFGPPCHAMWSCRSGGNVIINDQRWREATPTWPWGIDAYQHYVVNHEVGHFLGFGHSTCPGAGQRAPVMIQQSKGGAPMGSCSFNVWPVEAERQAAGRRQGVVPYPTGFPHVEDPVGHLDAVRVEGRRVVMSGWAADADSLGPLRVVGWVDGTWTGEAPADRPRPDVMAVHASVGPHRGVELTLVLDPGRHTVCAVALGVGPGAWVGLLGCRDVTV